MSLFISGPGAQPGGRPPSGVPTPAERFAATGDVAGAAEFVRANPDKFSEVEQAFFAKGDLSAVHQLSARARGPIGAAADAAVSAVQGAAGAKRAGFATRDAAAKAALSEANPRSIKANLEYGGLIYRTKDGKFGYTAPKQGTVDGFDPTSVKIPKGTKPAGDYHTHGDYSQVVGGKVVRTSDSAKDDFNSDRFSTTDLAGITNDAKGNPGYRGYLGTPSGDFRVFDPAAGTDKVLK